MQNQASVVAGRIPVFQHPLSQSLRKAIRFVSAPCGTGKTFAACRHIAANWDLANHLYVAPTATLLAETRGILKEQGVTCDIINSETHPNCVKTTIIEYLKTARQTGHKLLVTQQAYLDLPFFPNRRNWEIILDEVPQLDSLHPYQLPVYRNLLLEHIELAPYRQTGLYHVTAKDRSKINNLLQRPYDDVLELLKPLLKKLVSRNHVAIADQDTRDKLMGARVQKRGTHAQNRIYFLSVLSPQAFEPSAKTLAELTGCERVSQLGNLVPQRPAKLTSAQKANRAKAKKLLENLYAPDSIPASSFNDSGTKNGKPHAGAHFSDVIVTFHKNPYATSPSEHTVQVIETQAF